MPFDAKSAIPCDSDPLAEQPILDDAADGGVTLLTAPAGYVRTEGLAAVFQRRRRPVAWTRLGPEDGDPGVFLASLITAARHVRAERARPRSS
jgi:ATP/maltotriose-dependent transcriptional regulator MalT